MKLGFVVEPAEAGRRLDVVLAARAGVTRTLAQRALRSGTITVDGRAALPAHRLAGGEVVAGEVVPPQFATPAAEYIFVPVRYSDERVMVVSKPAGLVTHPAAGHETGTLVNALLALGQPLAAGASVRPGIVHRLDKGTSGLLLVAKDDEMQAHLVSAIRRRLVERRYLALVRGRPSAATGTIDAPVGRHPVRRTHMAVVPAGRRAVTHYRVLEHSSEVALLDVTLETGRTHQIRVHLAHLGHAVVGDRTYGGGGEIARRLGLGRPFLHAWRLVFPHPEKGETAVTDELPEDLADALRAAGLTPPVHD